MRKRGPPLTLVSPEAARRGDGARDWTGLMTRAQDGDRAAYRLLLNDAVPYVRSIAARCFSQSGDIEDAVQDVLLTLHAVRHTYDPDRPFGPWLLAITNRRIVDRLRGETRRRAREVALAAEHETFPDAATNFNEQHAHGHALGEAIERLPPDQAEAIRMLKLKEMSLKDAAMQSGRSVSALKVATHRAMKNLRRMLAPRGEP